MELAPLTDAQLISPTIGAILGVSLGASSAPNTALAAALRTKQLLLILDNCEHVIEQAARIAEALTRVCAQMTILATSRERLAIAGEIVIRVPSLPTPPSECRSFRDGRHANTPPCAYLLNERTRSALD